MTTFRGTRSADLLLGGAADDELFGLGGADTLGGYGGTDVLQGGTGDDSLAGYWFGTIDSDADALYGGGGNDYIEATLGDTVDGGEGDDTVLSNAKSPASLNGGLGYDTLRLNGDMSGSTLSGFERLEAAYLRSAMLLTVSQLDSFAVIGGAVGQSTVDLTLTTGGSATLTFDSALALANVHASAASVALSLMEGTRTALGFVGGGGDDSVTGSDGNDRLIGSYGSDSLRGGAGDDVLYAQYEKAPDPDPDWLFGASGNDEMWVGANDTAYGGTGSDTLVANGPAELDGGAGNDRFQSLSGEETIDGGPGVDTVGFARSARAVSVDLSDPGGPIRNVETLIGSRGDDIFVGTENAELFEGGQGHDSIDGGGGRDTASYSSAVEDVAVDVRILGGQDTGAGMDTLVGISNLIGGAGNDALTGGVGANVLEGGAGNDVIDGRIGVDLADYAHARAGVQVSLAVAGPQNTLGAGTDSLISMEDLRGSAFADGLAGSAAPNRLFGLGGNDIIVGAANNDTLTGGLGADRMRGGTGFDTFDFNATSESTRAAPDLILDFLGAGATWGDVIDLSTIDADTTVAGDQAFDFGSLGAGGLSLVDLGSDTLVRGNTDADAAFELAILLRDGGRDASVYADVDFIL